MAISSTSWKKGQTGNPHGRPCMGESIVRSLADELGARGQGAKLSKILVQKALKENADWRLQMELFRYFLSVSQYYSNKQIEERLDEIEKRLNDHV
jgi:hypothetical protein